jgi:hypothetical protein
MGSLIATGYWSRSAVPSSGRVCKRFTPGGTHESLHPSMPCRRDSTVFTREGIRPIVDEILARVLRL